MRRVLHGDVVAAARVLLLVPARARKATCRRMIRDAHFAHLYMKRQGRAHVLWGNGSLLSAASKRPMAREPFLSDTRYCNCLELVLHELALWQCRLSQPRRS